MPYGYTDAGLPLSLIKISSDGQFEPATWHQQQRCVLLINNGIHPGEPDGIDASMMFTRDMLQKMKRDSFPKNLAIVIVAAYNIGGMLNRSAYYRVDQNGPEEFGSRGNSQNLDLNRDFIKCDSKEAETFSKILQYIQPEVFIDNHVSDGADYPYVMTMATSQKDKLSGVLGRFLDERMEPALFQMMREKGYPVIPYVNVWSKDARDGWEQFFDSPRYSSGFTTLHNILSFVPETHMLKPYEQRVSATLCFMNCLSEYMSDHAKEIIQLKKTAIQKMLVQKNFPVQWECDTSSYTLIPYRGYEYEETRSNISRLPIHAYDHNKVYETQIKFYNHFRSTVMISSPEAYILPQGWRRVIERLQWNGVKMQSFSKDTTLYVQKYRIRNYVSSTTPYEGHHGNTKVEVEDVMDSVLCRKGDYFIPCHQNAKRFLIETLEPQGMDSYFSWNFFDPILIQKEGFTSYAFEKTAEEFLASYPALKDSLLKKAASDSSFKNNHHAWLDYIYKHSPYYEPGHNMYPVYRLLSSRKEEADKVRSDKVIGNKSDE